MGNKFSKKPLGVALGTVVAVSFSIAPMANAEQNPFELTDLTSGYTELAEKGETPEKQCGIEGYCGGSRCGEGKCGGQEPSSDKKPKKTTEMSCGGEGKCGGSK